MNTISAERSLISLFFKGLSDLFFPPSCLHCSVPLEESTFLFCQDCFENIEIIEKPLCSCCGKIFSSGNNHLCGECLQKKWHFAKARALVFYDDPVASAIVDFKFQGKKACLQTFFYIKKLSESTCDLDEPDWIIPVPLHAKRLRNRGFNQASLLAGAFFPDKRHKIINTILVRNRNTVPQTGLDGSQRRKNIRKAFLLCDNKKIKGKKILLIDDVFTTGTTVDECARVLMERGAKQVEVLTFARVRV